jgi:hypothetical protein
MGTFDLGGCEYNYLISFLATLLYIPISL